MCVNLTKIERRLQEVQERRKARLFDIKDIENILNRLETKRIQALQNPLGRKYLKRITCTAYFAVPCSYGYRAYTTVVYATISKSGSVKMEIYTDYAQPRPYGGYIEKFQEVYE